MHGESCSPGEELDLFIFVLCPLFCCDTVLPTSGVYGHSAYRVGGINSTCRYILYRYLEIPTFPCGSEKLEIRTEQP